MRTTLRRSLSSATALLILATTTLACSYLWHVTLDITIAEDVEIPEGAQLVIIQDGQAPTPDGREPADAPWGVVATETIELDQAEDARTHRYEGSTCCSPVETNYSWAFLDLDRDGEYDEGEPYGADPNNPVEVDDEYEVAFVVRNAP